MKTTLNMTKLSLWTKMKCTFWRFATKLLRRNSTLWVKIMIWSCSTKQSWFILLLTWMYTFKIFIIICLFPCFKLSNRTEHIPEQSILFRSILLYLRFENNLWEMWMTEMRQYMKLIWKTWLRNIYQCYSRQIKNFMIKLLICLLLKMQMWKHSIWIYFQM